MNGKTLSGACCLGLLGALAATEAMATNGMALSGYGAISMGLGGASQAYDTGNYGAINNAATLSLMEEGHRFEIGASLMHIDATTRMSGMPELDSDADWFLMPNLSYVTKQGRWSYGIGAFSQGGMGADYGKDSYLSIDPNSGQPTGLRDHSEVMVGRLILPLAFQATDRLSVGASLDLVYGRMTMQQAMPSQALVDMMTPGQQTLGTARVDPNTAAGLGSANYAHFDFSKLDNWGLGGQIGLTYRATDRLVLGTSYQFETHMGDLDGDGSIQAGVGSNYSTLSGDVKIKDFQWPATFKAGLAFQASDKLLLVADIKHYAWSEVMDALRIRFRPDSGGYVDVDMTQDWDDQWVYSIGMQYSVNDALQLRAGFNYAADPVPEEYLQHLGEAITESHLMLGLGYRISPHQRVDVAYTHAFENEETNTNPLVGLTSSLAQDTLSINYSHRF
ncbi:membrane protein involved in aromatic hydrocarbon degradation [Marichromatium purpuratum 984]|uniref:Membrane protein involved in aromatic hydrocarbon degradation n=1 Tax=Marichromatium purpuratum 984 TaxID=765910 RepID=W0E2Y6_MARPU|nr:outer membrane protein transport protein [Marichromatium purpuratum]AHF05107.1 membrane protein involved in aromatic hydrocarbon degradation [Marichromatium purpuratum 984]